MLSCLLDVAEKYYCYGAASYNGNVKQYDPNCGYNETTQNCVLKICNDYRS